MTKHTFDMERIEGLPFTVEKMDDHLIVSQKPKGHLSKQKRKEFEKNKTTVKVELFDQEYFDRLNKIKIEWESNFTFWDVVKLVHKSVIKILMK